MFLPAAYSIAGSVERPRHADAAGGDVERRPLAPRLAPRFPGKRPGRVAEERAGDGVGKPVLAARGAREVGDRRDAEQPLHAVFARVRGNRGEHDGGVAGGGGGGLVFAAAGGEGRGWSLSSLRRGWREPALPPAPGRARPPASFGRVLATGAMPPASSAATPASESCGRDWSKANTAERPSAATGSASPERMS